MFVVQMFGCENGRRRKPLYSIQIGKLLRTYTNLSSASGLKEIHQIITRLADCETISVDFNSLSEAQSFAEEVAKLGAVSTVLTLPIDETPAFECHSLPREVRK